MARVFVAGLNPAWQQVFSLVALRAEGVQRADAFHALASGKGMNAAGVLARFGHEVTLLQILGGVNGQRCLDACDALGIRSLHVWAKGETRVCATLLHDGKAAEIIAPFSVEPPGLDRELLALIPEGTACDALLICGSAPAGIPRETCARIAARMRPPLLVWDSVARWTPEVAPFITWLKVNAKEYRDLAPLLKENATQGRALITDGSNPVVVRGGDAAASCTPPVAGPMINPIGAGDAVTAMLADGLLRGLDEKAAVTRALAAATASCLHPLPAEWDTAEAERMEREIRWKET